ncbi:glycosyltransferase [Cyanobium sp. L1E-Cus]|uniref:glycosyltransferase n=1 Tax=Cyanobium sp. L1E-Cus TaxID=2823714 RepID=UPI0020CED32F|nr:glycosyltransferase [Cyanobium sp. L1E-Cus]MCP9822534.1 glycosyltransferase [Cyanobium sp. L1E-Cus]
MNISRNLRVLVVVPTLGRRLQTLEQTLHSLRTQPDIEVDIVLVVPFASDSLQTIASSFRAKLVVEKGHLSASINRGFGEAGPDNSYLAWIGDDDMIPEGALARSVAQLEKNADAPLCFGDCAYVDRAGRAMFTRRPPLLASWLIQFIPGLIKSETCVFRRTAVISVGGLNEDLRFAMDLDLILRLRALGRLARCPAVQGVFCWHPGSITVSNREDSFAEAQLVQLRLTQGFPRYASLLVQPLLKRLFLALSHCVDRRHAGMSA